MSKRFSFDLGVTSVGWAVFETSHDATYKLIDAGSRVFSEPRNPQSKQSLAVARREARARRRQIRRSSTRRRLMINLFKSFEWLPKDMNPPYGFSGNPYQVRSKALDQILSPHELSEAFFHLAKRRGFKSNRKGNPDTAELNEITQAAEELKLEMSKHGHRTLGEHLAFLYNQDPLKRLRGRRTTRQMYLDEFQIIVDSQMRLGSPFLTRENVEKLSRVIFYQLPFELQKERRIKTLGPCLCEPNEPRAYRYEPLAIEFRIIKTVNQIKVIDPHTSDEIPLTHEQRESVIFALLEFKKVTFDKIKKLIDVPNTYELNLESSRRDDIKGDPYYSSIKRALKKRYSRGLKREIQTLCEIFHSSESIEEALSLISARDLSIHLTPDEVSKIYKGFPDPEEGTSAYSLKALEKLLPHLLEGKSEYSAVNALYPSQDLDTSEFIPLPKVKITNPSVNRTVHQFRRVYNALVKLYGKPESVAIELAKDIKKSKKSKLNESIRQKAREQQRDKYKEQIIEAGMAPSSSLILKLELAHQQGNLCPYTGKSFGYAEIFSDGILEIDHILPYSRSVDDSMMNLVLVYRDANKEKGNRTPGEWQQGSEYDAMIARVLKMKFSYLKKKRFYRGVKAEVDGFISQQLNDTRYASKYVRELVEQTFPSSERKKKISTLKGAHTSILRRQWNLSKDRNDLRHHAVDAVLVGLVTPKILKSLSTLRGSYEDHFHVPLPYPELHRDLNLILERMIVSRRQSRKQSGAFHTETSYSLPKAHTDDQYVIIHHRIDLSKITPPQIDKIADDVIKELVLERLAKNGGDISKGFDGLTMKSGVAIKKVRIKERLRRSTIKIQTQKDINTPYRSVANAGNYSLSIRENPDTGKSTCDITTVPLKSIDEGTQRTQLTLHKTDGVRVSDLWIGYVKKISSVGANTPDVSIDRHNVGQGKTMGLDTIRYSNTAELIREVQPVSISILGKLE